MTPGKRSPWEARLWLPFLIILTPFLIFLNENTYSFAAKGPWILGFTMAAFAFFCSALGWYRGGLIEKLIIAGLVIFFVDIRSDWLSAIPWWGVLLAFLGVLFVSYLMKEAFFKITGAVFAVFLAVTLLQILFPRSELDRDWNMRAADLNDGYPARIVHLVLDAHIGIEGIPIDFEGGPALKKRLVEFYEKHGFHLFGESYSHYSTTMESIPKLLNFSDTNEPNAFTKPGNIWVRRLDQNRYFEGIEKFGYRLNVWDSNFLEFCPDRVTEIDNCARYNVHDTRILQSYDLALSDQLTTLFADYTRRTSTYKRIKKAYPRVRSAAAEYGLAIPAWTWDRFIALSPLNSFRAFDMLEKEIVSLPDGNFVLAHLLLPHAPYAIRSDCSVNKNLDEWHPDKEVLGRAAWREETYPLFFDQAECLYTRLEALFNEMKERGIYEDSLIIIHGDHGSRISLTEPLIGNEEKITARDLADVYSTIFSVKFPRGVAKYDGRVFPLERLLHAVVANSLDSDAFADIHPETGFVYLNKVTEVNSRYDNELVAIPYPMKEARGE